ncbi:MAG: alpha/beta hydrolase [Acidobacteriota bacterium]
MVLRALRLGTSTALRLRGGRPFEEWFGATRLVGYRFGSPQADETWILLHGLASTALSWHRTAWHLRRDCRVIVPELSGLGGTESIGGGLGVADGVRVISALIERESPGRRVTLAGNSLGAWIALRIALERPELLDRLVLIAAAGYRDQDWERIKELVTVRDSQDVDPLLRALFVRTPLGLRLARKGFQRAYGSPEVASVLAKLREEDAYGDRELQSLALPTAVIWGEHDGIFDFAVAERMAAALPQAHLYRLDDCGHAAHWEKPSAIDRALDDFRQRYPTPRPADAAEEVPA